MTKLRRAIPGILLGAAVGLFAGELGLPLLLSFWGGNAAVIVGSAAMGGALFAILGPRRGGRWLTYGFGTLVVFYFVVAFGPLCRLLVKELPRNDAGDGKADAVFVFGSRMQRSGHFTDTALSRLVHGLELLGDGRAPRLVLSELAPPSRKYSVAAAQLMGHLGLKREILVVEPVYNTHDEAIAVAKLFRAKGWHRVLAVTSPLHSRRACGALEQEGLVVICSPSSETGYDLDSLRRPDDRLAAFRGAIHEHLGLFVYRLRGWLGSG